MRKLRNYIATTVLSTILIVTVVLVGLELFILFVGQLDSIGQGSFDLLAAMHYAVLSLPLEIYNLFPMAALLGSLVGLGLLATHSELIVMQTSGVSVMQITWAVLRMALLLVLVVTVLGECFGPRLTKQAEITKQNLLNGGQTLHTEHGTWVRHDNEYVRIAAVTTKQLRGVTLYEFNNKHQLVKASYADTASFIDKHWVLHHVKQSVITPTRVLVRDIKNLNTSIVLNPKMLGADLLGPSQMSLPDLYKLIHYRSASGLQYNNFLLAFWQRLLRPLTTAVMMFLAIPFIFGPLRSATMGLRIVTGVVVGFGFYLLNQFLGPASLVYQIPAGLAAILPTIFFFFIALWLMLRARGR